MSNFSDFIERPYDGAVVYEGTLAKREKFVAYKGQWYMTAIEDLYFVESLVHGDCVVAITLETFDYPELATANLT